MCIYCTYIVKDTVWFELTVFLVLIDVTLRSYDINIGKKIRDIVCRS